MIKFETIRWKNFLSTGDNYTEIQLDRSPSTLVVGKNGNGKCLRGTTEIDIEFSDKETKKKFMSFLE